jgi:hypothetical protein
MTSGAQARYSWFVEVGSGLLGVLISFKAFFMPPGHSFWLPVILGDEVDGARDDSWRGFFVVSLLGD